MIAQKKQVGPEARQSNIVGTFDALWPNGWVLKGLVRWQSRPKSEASSATSGYMLATSGLLAGAALKASMAAKGYDISGGSVHTTHNLDMVAMSMNLDPATTTQPTPEAPAPEDNNAEVAALYAGGAIVVGAVLGAGLYALHRWDFNRKGLR